MFDVRAPGRYVQGPTALADAEDHLVHLAAERAVLAGGETALSVAGERLRVGLAEAGIEAAETVRGVGAATEERIADVEAAVSAAGADCVVGVGGGTAVDAAKASARRASVEFVSVPTVPSSDAPASGLSVIYDGAGRPVDSVPRGRPPELVLADTSVLAAAPARFLRWGLGDALATTYEAEACAAADGVTPHDATPGEAGLALARRCGAVVATDGVDALAAVAEDRVTPAVERAVEAVLLCSAMGFENGGLAGAHSLEVGCRLAGHTDPPHGALVGACTLAQLVHEDHDDVGVVTARLADLGFEDPLPPDGLVDDAAEWACDDVAMMDNEPIEVEPADAAAALRRARELLADAG